MQAEKYLLHLFKWGVQGEKALNKRYASQTGKAATFVHQFSSKLGVIA